MKHDLFLHHLSLIHILFTYDMAVALSEAATKKNQDVAIHIAVDTGMSRIGYQVEKENRCV